MTKTIPKTEQKAIKDFKKQLAEGLNDNLLRVYLFGSKARGDYQKESDIDILAVLKQPKENDINYIYETAMSVGMKYQVYLSIKIFSEKEFNYYSQIPTRFIANVLNEGVII